MCRVGLRLHGSTYSCAWQHGGVMNPRLTLVFSSLILHVNVSCIMDEKALSIWDVSLFLIS
jgi:hypothetical protein